MDKELVKIAEFRAKVNKYDEVKDQDSTKTPDSSPPAPTPSPSPPAGVTSDQVGVTSDQLVKPDKPVDSELVLSKPVNKESSPDRDSGSEGNSSSLEMGIEEAKTRADLEVS